MESNYRIPYGCQWIDEDDVQEVARALRSAWLTQGPFVEEFERKIAEYCGVRYAVAFSSGTAALHAAYAAAGIAPGAEVITSPLTFAATANGVMYCGGTPVFADILQDTLTLNPKEAEKRINAKTKALAPIDFAGHPAEYEELRALAKQYNLVLIADAAHSLGSVYKGKRVGSLADMTILSFHPVKTITTGEGGMVVTDNEVYASFMKRFRHHGIEKKPERGGWYYEIQELGYNYRLTDIQCALGLSQLKQLEKFIRRRNEIIARYNKAFAEIPELILPFKREESDPAYHLYVVQFKLENLKSTRKEIFEKFHKRNIFVQVHYMPVHLHPFYQKTFGYRSGDFPIAENYYERTLSIPLFPKMTDHEVEYVITRMEEIIQESRVESQ